MKECADLTTDLSINIALAELGLGPGMRFTRSSNHPSDVTSHMFVGQLMVEHKSSSLITGQTCNKARPRAMINHKKLRLLNYQGYQSEIITSITVWVALLTSTPDNTKSPQIVVEAVVKLMMKLVVELMMKLVLELVL